mmetsp:Transcript_18068/g.49241  ORF Transcript_18068/g.49241 Transcript_18068/m.49241 type:complete len:99 (-) Transcript_18068:1385-1681(-)
MPIMTANAMIAQAASMPQVFNRATSKTQTAKLVPATSRFRAQLPVSHKSTESRLLLAQKKMKLKMPRKKIVITKFSLDQPGEINAKIALPLELKKMWW